ncbi:MAG: helix-turn-helix domain-containing protein [Clostridia bacterium]|nr:helix-turn-helix domain-containing protein [Clostridia bacterium]
MTKGRKTTQEERAEIVAYCIEHGKDYPLTIQTYGVSYQQVYAWVRKYEDRGIDGLRDGRGRTKPVEELNETERLKLENKILKAQLKDAEMENKLLKKLRELRGGD